MNTVQTAAAKGTTLQTPHCSMLAWFIGASETLVIPVASFASHISQVCLMILISFGLITSAALAQSPAVVLPQNNSSDSNPFVAMPCYVTGDPLASGNNVSGEHVLIVLPYNASGKAYSGGTALHRFSNADQIGTVRGTTADLPSNKIYSAAVLKRHLALGPNGFGVIYHGLGGKRPLPKAPPPLSHFLHHLT